MQKLSIIHYTTLFIQWLNIKGWLYRICISAPHRVYSIGLIESKKSLFGSNSGRDLCLFGQLFNFFSELVFEVVVMLFVLFFVVDDVSVDEAVTVDVVVGDPLTDDHSVLDHILFEVQLHTKTVAKNCKNICFRSITIC